MSDRPAFLTVSYSGSGLNTMGYEKKMIRQEDVKFAGDDGTIELTDVRIVWYRKPSRKGGLKKFGALAGAIAGAAVLEGVGRQVGGIGGSAIRGIGRGIGVAAVGSAVSSWTRDSFYNRDKNGNTESLAVPIVAIATAQQSGKKLVIELKSGGNMEFEFKKDKVIPSVTANIVQAQHVGKCPFCGSQTGDAIACPNCGAPIEGGGGGGRSKGSGGGGTVHVHVPSGGGAFCTNCGEAVPAGAKFCGSCGSKI